MTSDQQTPHTRGSHARSTRRPPGRRHATHSPQRVLAPIPLRLWLREDAPWITILCLTSGFQFFRGAPLDGAVFAAAAIALGLANLGLLQFVGSTRVARPVLGYAVGALIVVVVALLPRFSLADGVIVIGVGLTAIPFAWSDQGRWPPYTRAKNGAVSGTDRASGHSPTRALRRAAILWSALAVALCLWELTAFFLGMPSAAAEYAHPALSDLIMPLLANPLSLGVGTALWLLGGAALLRRGCPR